MSNNKLSDEIISLIEASGINDYDQRSAIGMARSWVDNQKPIVWNPEQIENRKRDQLAKDIVAILEANLATEEEYVAALRTARDHVNAPFQVATHSGAALQKPGALRKAREAAKA